MPTSKSWGTYKLSRFSEHLPDPPRVLSLEPGLLLPRGRLSAGFGLHFPVDFGDDLVNALLLLEHLLWCLLHWLSLLELVNSDSRWNPFLTLRVNLNLPTTK